MATTKKTKKVSSNDLEDKESGWLFDGKPFMISQSKGYAGFVYLIIEKETGRKYIGRKYFDTRRRPKGKAIRVKSQSDWPDYWSSSDELKRLVSLYGKDKFERHILSLHTTLGDTNITEIREQFARNVLDDDSYINESILGKYAKTSKKILASRKVSQNFR